MPSIRSPEPHIFEDADATPLKMEKFHKRIPSVGDVLRGRRMKENKDPMTPSQMSTQSPLSELHINSPPQTRRVPIKDGQSRPPMHKKTSSGVSFKGFMKNKDKTTDNGSISSTDGRSESKSPKKTKSSTNLAGLLKKRSRKDLKTDNDENEMNRNVKPRTPVAAPTPIWAQFATQPLEGPDGSVQYPEAKRRTLQEEINLYTPRDYSDFRSSQRQDFYGVQPPSTALERPPQRPFLEHKNSRSSIFIENMDDDVVASPLDRPKSRGNSTSRPSSSGLPSTEYRQPPAPLSKENPKRSSRVLDAINTFNLKSRKEQCHTPRTSGTQDQQLSSQELDSAFEWVLDSLNIPHNMRDNMRNLKPEVKAGLVKGERIGSGSSTNSMLTEYRSSARNPPKTYAENIVSQVVDLKQEKRARSRSRPRSGILSMSKRDTDSPTKKEKGEQSSRSRSKSRPRSMDLTKSQASKGMASSTSLHTLATPDSATTPGDFIHYLREVQKPELVEVGKLHKLRILLRNESVMWTDAFITKGGMEELIQLLYRIIKVEWREEHEDALLHETLLCLKALSTTSLALKTLEDVQDEFFPALLAMLFDQEKKGPSEFNTRGVIISLLFVHLSAAMHGTPKEFETRAKTLLGYLKDPIPEEEKQPLGFISQMHIPRPYRVWCKEVVNVTKEVFWIFLHNMNVIPVVQTENDAASFMQQHFPPPRSPHPAAPYVGGVEWEATQYISIHLDVLNGIIATLPTQWERNQLREDMRESGWEKAMGGTLRTCKEKFYGAVHEGLKVWLAAARADGWPVEDVRAGPPREASPKKSPVKRKIDEAPKIALDVGVAQSLPRMDDAWV